MRSVGFLEYYMKGMGFCRDAHEATVLLQSGRSCGVKPQHRSRMALHRVKPCAALLLLAHFASKEGGSD